MGLLCVYRLRPNKDGMINVFWRVSDRWMHCHGPTTKQAALMWIEDRIAQPL